MESNPITRTRTDDTTVPLMTSQTTTLCNGDVSTVSVNEWDSQAGGYKLGNGVYRQTTDVVVPNFRARSARGEVFMNPFASTRTTRFSASIGTHEHHWVPNCTGTNTKKIEGNNSFGCWGGFLGAQSGWVDHTQELRELAGTQAWSNVAEPNVLGGEFLRDRERTFRMLKNPLSDLRHALGGIRKSRKFGRSGLILGHYVANEWLKYRYGLTPLIHDVVGAFENVCKPVFTDRVTARGSAAWPEYQYTDTVVQTGTYGIFQGTTVRKASQSQNVRAGVLYRHEASMSEKFGISFNSLVPTLWEILPYSFVADWFANVGQYLAAVTPKAYTTVLAEWTTTKVVHRQQSTMTSVPLTVANVSQTGGPAIMGTTERVVITRTPGAPRALQWRINDLDLSMSKTQLHVADAFALIGGMLVSRYRGVVNRRPKPIRKYF